MRFLPLIAFTLIVTACGGVEPENDAVGLGDLKGQWVLVNYWAEWCKPCIEEIPELNDFDAARTDVSVIGVNFEGSTGEELSRQVQKLGIAFAIVSDPSSELGIRRPAVLPTTLLVSPEGALVDQLLGPQTGESLHAALQKAAEQSP